MSALRIHRDHGRVGGSKDDLGARRASAGVA